MTRQAYAHEALLDLDPDGDDAAPGGAITVALCGNWTHDPPCPLAPHHTRAHRSGKEVTLRLLFATEPEEEPRRGGVVVDLSRKRLILDDETASLTYKEFELLQYLVLREGHTIERAELIASLWSAGDDDVPNERTIDVHVRRLRAKLGAYEDIVRTVRGVGYRFDRHADVSVRHASAPSPDIF